jgi:hypothetical protein
MKLEELKRLGLDVKPGSRSKQGVEFYICCPFCVKLGKSPDTGYRLGFNIKKNLYHCYRCESRGKLKDIAELGLLVHYTSNPSLDELQETIKDMMDNSKKTEFVSYDLEKMSWPIDPVETEVAYRYMLTRGYSPEELIRYKVRVGKSYLEGAKTIKRWSGRIVFPFFYRDKCIYMVGRAYTGKEPKYINPDAPKGLIVYGIDEVKGKTVILCEGIISAHSAERATGISAVAVLGKDPLDLQLQRIRDKCEVIYLSFDGDVDPAKKARVFKRLMSFGFQIWDVELPNGQDPDSLKDQYSLYFQNAKKISLF